MQYVRLFYQRLQKARIRVGVYLRSGGFCARVQHFVEVSERIGIFTHIVLVIGAVYVVGIKNNGDIALANVRIRQIDRRFATDDKFIHDNKILLSVFCTIIVILSLRKFNLPLESAILLLEKA